MEFREGQEFDIKEFKSLVNKLKNEGWRYNIMDSDYDKNGNIIHNVNEKKLVGYYIDKIDNKTKYVDIFRIYE